MAGHGRGRGPRWSPHALTGPLSSWGGGGGVALPVVAVVSSLGTSRQQLPPALCSFGDPQPPSTRLEVGPLRDHKPDGERRLSVGLPHPRVPWPGGWPHRLACSERASIWKASPRAGRLPDAPSQSPNRSTLTQVAAATRPGMALYCTCIHVVVADLFAAVRYHQRSACYHQERPPPARSAT